MPTMTGTRVLQQKAWYTFLKREMILSPGNGSQLLVHRLKFAACFGVQT
jgi:hypothetical protein